MKNDKTEGSEEIKENIIKEIRKYKKILLKISDPFHAKMSKYDKEWITVGSRLHVQTASSGSRKIGAFTTGKRALCPYISQLAVRTATSTPVHLHFTCNISVFVYPGLCHGLPLFLFLTLPLTGPESMAPSIHSYTEKGSCPQPGSQTPPHPHPPRSAPVVHISVTLPGPCS